MTHTSFGIIYTNIHVLNIRVCSPDTDTEIRIRIRIRGYVSGSRVVLARVHTDRIDVWVQTWCIGYARISLSIPSACYVVPPAPRVVGVSAHHLPRHGTDQPLRSKTGLQHKKADGKFKGLELS
jgi:hypothetical protein